ncbi:hypothetical protein [Paraburkholderia caballeronis]|uniref:hypothetical protein n=1 Tax=Paraburkholderia caballeronis TaxID=416943 RepID=UPI001064F34A|nr:hypothetical protein [Paraburkholderia caballeronis]
MTAFSGAVCTRMHPGDAAAVGYAGFAAPEELAAFINGVRIKPGNQCRRVLHAQHAGQMLARIDGLERMWIAHAAIPMANGHVRGDVAAADRSVRRTWPDRGGT